MSTGPTNLADLAKATLAVVVAAFATDGVDLPERRYITTGPTLGVCDAVIVSWTKLGPGAVGSAEAPRLTDASNGRVAILTVDIWRCGYPTPRGVGMVVEPAPEAFTAFATTVMTDAYVLQRGLQRAVREGTFTDYGSRVRCGDATPHEPLSGMAGTTMLLEVAVL